MPTPEPARTAAPAPASPPGRRRAPSRRRAVPAALVLALLLAACGGGGGDAPQDDATDTADAAGAAAEPATTDDTGAGAAATDAAADEPAGEAAEPAATDDAEGAGGAAAAASADVVTEGCPEPPYQVLARFEGDGPLEPFEITDAVALDGGPLAVLVVASGATIDRSTDLSTGYPQVPADAVLLDMGIYSGEDVSGEPDLAPGDTFAGGDLRHPSLAVVQGAPQGAWLNPTEHATVREVDDDRICIDFQLDSESGLAFQGPVVAEVVG